MPENDDQSDEKPWSKGSDDDTQPEAEPQDGRGGSDGSGRNGSTTQTAPDTAAGAPTTSTPPAHRRRD